MLIIIMFLFTDYIITKRDTLSFMLLCDWLRSVINIDGVTEQPNHDTVYMYDHKCTLYNFEWVYIIGTVLQITSFIYITVVSFILLA